MNDQVIYIVCSLSLIVNCILCLIVFKMKKSKKMLKDSRELQEFMLDLMQGDALVRVSRVSPQDVFLRSPRGL